MESSDGRLIRLIAVVKFFKAILLIAIGIGALRLVHQDIASVLEHWIVALKLDPSSHVIDAALSKASHISPEQIKKLGVGSFLYAGLFLTEGIGLWLLKRWAEWLTVIITSSLLPLEIYEIHHHPTAPEWLALAVNLAIVAYLIFRIRKR